MKGMVYLVLRLSPELSFYEIDLLIEMTLRQLQKLRILERRYVND